jgi:flagellar motor switch protein FliN/FliY
MNEDPANEVRPAAAELATVSEPPQDGAAAAGRLPPERVSVAEPDAPRHIETVMQIPVSVKIVLGSATMPVANVLKLGRGAVVPLDRKVGEPVDVVVNGRIVARGEVVVLDEDSSRFGVSLTEVIGFSGPTKAA